MLMRTLSRWTARYYLKRPDQAELIHIKHPRLRDLWPSLVNELCFRLGRDRSFRLTGLNVEITNRCNLSCRHCLRGGKTAREERDMDPMTFRRIVDQCPHVKTILPFQWGEPLLNPAVFECIAYAAQRKIRVMMTTNGTLLDERASKRLIEAGLTRLTVSFDGSRESHAALRGVDPDRIVYNVDRFREIRDRAGSPCRLDLSMVVDAGTEPHIDAFHRLFRNRADRMQLVPRLVPGVRTRPCRELWRGVLVVLSGGEVTLCCADEQGRGVFGNIEEETLPRLFNGPALCAVRRGHRTGDFPEPCRTCAEYASPRVSPRF